ncbi:hypothetical protein, partial [Aeromonas caviae]|uniref:hypothetical protein n=1 Tax=Aeromonas caviae TaxID=648 RepID=UPI001FC7CDC7
AKRRSVEPQHCAFWGVLGGIWLGGKFSHAKTSIEHKRRYAYWFEGGEAIHFCVESALYV